jgi:hypothetical protein
MLCRLRSPSLRPLLLCVSPISADNCSALAGSCSASSGSCPASADNSLVLAGSCPATAGKRKLPLSPLRERGWGWGDSLPLASAQQQPSQPHTQRQQARGFGYGIQQEGFRAPRGGVVALPYNIAPIGGDGVCKPKLRAVGQQAGIGRVQVFHAARRRPAKGTIKPCGVGSRADHHAPIG